MDRERLKGNLDLLLLSVLSAGPAHGYAIISALRDRSGGTFTPRARPSAPTFPYRRPGLPLVNGHRL